MSLEALFVGDLHLGGMTNLFPNYTFSPDDMVYKTLTYAFRYAQEEGIKHVFLLGDIFDHPYPTQEQQERLLAFLMRFPKLYVYLNAGNHDFSTEHHLSLRMVDFTSRISQKLEHVKLFTKPELLEIRGVPVSMLPWPHAKTLEKKSLNIAHIEISNSVSDNGKTLKNGYQLSPTGCYVIGHLHRRQMYSKRVYYPGTMFQKTFGEPLPKGFGRGLFSYKRGQLDWSMDWIEYQPPYQLYNVRIQQPQDFKLIKKPNPDKIVQYKIFIKNGVEIPPGFLEEYHNVVDAAGKLTLKEIDTLEKQGFSFDVTQDDQTLDLLDILDPFLEKEGLSKDDIKIAHTYVKRYQEQSNV